MRTAFRFLLAVVLLACAGCGGDGGSGLRTTGAGTVVISATDERAGLEVEIQDDSLYVHLTEDAPDAVRELEGEPLGGACEVDGAGGVGVSRQFPIYWREDPGDWGSAVVRRPAAGGKDEVLAQHVTSCRIFAPHPTGVPDQSSFNEATDEPIANVKLRR